MLGTAAAGMTCPSTAAWGPAAGMKITTVASTGCDKVEAEIKARVNGQSTSTDRGLWHDPHNNGLYTLENVAGRPPYSYGATISTSRLTGDGKYTDKQIFTLTPVEAGGFAVCRIEACSRSQVTSVLDMGTNYCDLKMLFCGKADGCKPVEEDFTVCVNREDSGVCQTSETTEKFSQASVDLSKCLVAAENNVVV